MHRSRYTNIAIKLTAMLVLITGIGLDLRSGSASDTETTQVSVPPEKRIRRTILGSPHAGHTRLNFLSKTWPEVLQKVSTDLALELDMPEAPPGKFSRTDLAMHDRDSAMRILNRDLEKVGYRVVADDHSMTVISIKKERKNYSPSVTGRAPRPVDAAAAQQITRIGTQENKQALQSPLEKMEPIQRVSYETEAKAPESKPVTSASIKPKNRSSLDIARQIHLAFKSRSRLENAGPQGLPAFVVEHFDPAAVQAGQPLFVIEIDTDRDELIITAEQTVQQGIQRLIQSVDRNPLAGGNLPTLIADDHDTVNLGKKLAKPLTLIAQAQTTQSATAAQSSEADTAAQQPTAQAGDNSSIGVIPGVSPQLQQELPSLLGRLKGDVTIQALDDLDLLIIEGNEQDVEAVRRVIGAIEQMAVGSLPEIHLLRLQHVDSQSLSTLLNDVYEKMTNLRTNNAQKSDAAVNVIPVVTPNAVLILASATAMEAILQLADELDQPVDPEHEIQIFRLKHAISSEVAEKTQEFYGDTPVGLGTRIKIAADDRTNSVIVQAKPRDLSEISRFIKSMDSEQAGSVSQLRVVPLKSASADELAQFLNSAIQSAVSPAPGPVAPGQSGLGGFGQGSQTGGANQTARAVVLEFLLDEGRQLRSGLLNDVRFNADPRTNSLLVTAPEQSLPLIMELINILDRPAEAQADIKVYPLENADAISAVELLNSLFNQTQNQGGAQNQSQALGVEIVGAEGSSGNLIPLRFYADSRTNSVVAIGGTASLRMVHTILLQMDTRGAQSRKVSVIELLNSPAADVAASINDFLASQRELATIDPDRISTSQLLEQEIIVTAEPISNQLIISATPAYLPQIEQLAKTLDAEPRQVVIQALLVEVELDNTDEFGVELGFQDKVLFNRSSIAADTLTTITQTISQPGQPQVTSTQVLSQQGNPGFNFNNGGPLGNNIGPNSRSGTVAGQGLTNFSVGRVNNDLGYGGMVLSASSESVSVLVRALAARRTLRILSRPQVTVLNGQQAEIQVGQVVPVVDGLTITAQGIVNPTIFRDNAGLILNVRPRISPEGQIVMLVTAEKSIYGGASVPIGSDGAGGVITAPIKDITTAFTTVKVPDGQTAIIGGMITKSDQNTERKVPWLSDLPLVGNIFRYDLNQTRRTELLIFLTPRIVRGDADMEMIKEIEAGRINFFQDDAEAMHGPLFGVPMDGLDMPLLHEQYPGELIIPNQLPPAYAPESYKQVPTPANSAPGQLPVPPAPGLINPSAAQRPATTKETKVWKLGEVPAETN